MIAIVGGESGELYHIPEGNDQIPKKLAESYVDKVELNTAVTKIEFDQVKQQNRVFFKDLNQKEFQEDFDYVVVCCPLELTKIEISDPKPFLEVNERHYLTIHVNVVLGRLNPSYFGFKNQNDLPAVIITNKPHQSKIITLETSKVTDTENNKDLHMIHIFSHEALEEKDFLSIFEHIEGKFQTVR